MSRATALFIIPALLLAIAASGCAKRPSADEGVLVTVSDSPITVNDLNARIEKMPPYYRKIVEKNKKRYVEEMVIERLFYEDAIRQRYDRDREVADLLKEAKRKVLIAKLIKAEVDDKINVTEEELRQYYEAHKGDFKTPELWRASHILVATEKEATDILEALSKGAKFEDLARERSMDATSSRGGDIGFFRVGQLVPDFEKAALALNMGQTSGVIRTQFGYHIIRLTDKKAAGIEDFDRARGKIDNELKKKKRVELFDKLVMDLKKKYGVKINDELFGALDNPAQDAQGGAK